MKRKIFSILTVLLLLFAFSAQAIAQDYDDDDEPRRRRGRRGYGFLANRTLAVGLIGAVHLSTSYYVDGVKTGTTENNDQQKYFGLQGRLFLTPSFGGSIDIVLLDSQDYPFHTANLYLLNFGLVYRLQVTRSIVANGGLGISQTMLQIEDKFSSATATEYGLPGYYLRIGGEIFFGAGRRLSVSADWSWITWGETDISGGAEYSRRILTFQLGVHYWL